MKELKPKFILTSVYSDGSQDEPEIVTLSQSIRESKMNRRGFFGAGMTAAAALTFLSGCGDDDPEPLPEPEPTIETPNDAPIEQGDNCGYNAHQKDVYALAMDPSGKQFFSGAEDVKIWSLPEGAFIQKLSANATIESLVVTPDGKLLVSGSVDSTIKLWNLPEGTLAKTLTGHSQTISSLVVTPDGKLLVSGSHDNTIKLWNLPDGTLAKTLTGHSYGIGSLAITPDGKLLVSGSCDYTGENDNSIKLWNLPDGTEVKTLVEENNINSLAVTPDGKWLLSGDSGGIIKLIKLPDGKVTKIMKAHSSWMNDFTVSPDGKYFFSGSDNIIKYWSLPDFVLKRTLELDSKVYSLAVTPNESRLVAGMYSGNVQLLKLPELALDKCLLDLNITKDTVKGLTYSLKDETGRTVTYTLPCGSPIPAGATCTCNCVPGKVCSCNSDCSCNSQCTCNSQCSCVSNNSNCRCQRVGTCTCNQVCTCNKVCTCLAT